mmetsp:Transcript_27187/g.71553  ORF Transcript_27187/g.71553 Transcript_27187/m.71553 type:complete len:215 (-) Transcript_27187:936-1580(-)
MRPRCHRQHIPCQRPSLRSRLFGSVRAATPEMTNTADPLCAAASHTNIAQTVEAPAKLLRPNRNRCPARAVDLRSQFKRVLDACADLREEVWDAGTERWTHLASGMEKHREPLKSRGVVAALDKQSVAHAFTLTCTRTSLCTTQATDRLQEVRTHLTKMLQGFSELFTARLRFCKVQVEQPLHGHLQSVAVTEARLAKHAENQCRVNSEPLEDN